MLHQFGIVTEGFSTLFTWIRLLSGVGALMLPELGAAPEALSTLTAFMRFLSSVDSLMLIKLRAQPEDFPTLLTLIRLLSMAATWMLSLQAGRERLLALLTSAGFLLHVDFPGQSSIWGVPESSATCFASLQRSFCSLSLTVARLTIHATAHQLLTSPGSVCGEGLRSLRALAWTVFLDAGAPHSQAKAVRMTL